MTVNKDQLLADMRKFPKQFDANDQSLVASTTVEELLENYRREVDALLGPTTPFPDLGPLSSSDENKGDEFLDRAKQLVKDWYFDYHNTIPNTVYIVWFAYILGGWKALVSTSVEDGRYHEVTHNVAKGETYHDVYEKQYNEVHKEQA